jgi:hypothetical protein
MDKPRYFVDERVGCIAVRDRTKVDPNHNGLHSDMACVVMYFGGVLIPGKCPTCNQTYGGCWSVTQEQRMLAQYECDRLNGGTNV